MDQFIIVNSIAATGTELNQRLNSQKTPYTSPMNLDVTGELLGVFCKDLGENWLRYHGTALYNNWWFGSSHGQAISSHGIDYVAE